MYFRYNKTKEYVRERERERWGWREGSVSECSYSEFR